MYDVGEQGRERVFLPAGAAVISNKMLRALEGGGGGGGSGQMLENHVTVTVGPHQLVQAIQYSLAKDKAVR